MIERAKALSRLFRDGRVTRLCKESGLQELPCKSVGESWVPALHAAIASLSITDRVSPAFRIVLLPQNANRIGSTVADACKTSSSPLGVLQIG